MIHPIRTSRFSTAVALAEAAHTGQTRKGTDLPYLLHPLAVASLVIEYGGDEDQAIAGLLHDVIEDGGQHYESIIADAFGPRVLQMVLACTDGSKEHKARAVTAADKAADWRQRKLEYLERLKHETPDALLVSACDKLHNVRAIIADLRVHGAGVFARFTTGCEGTLWYYGAVRDVLNARGIAPARDLAAEVATLCQLAAEPDDPQPLADALAARLDGEGRRQLLRLTATLEARAQHALAGATRALGEWSRHQQTLLALRMQMSDGAQGGH